MFYSIIHCSLVHDWQIYRGGASTFSMGKQANLQNKSSQGKHTQKSIPLSEVSRVSMLWKVSWNQHQLRCMDNIERPCGHPLLLNGLFPIKTCSVALSLSLRTHRSGVPQGSCSTLSHPAYGIANYSFITSGNMGRCWDIYRNFLCSKQIKHYRRICNMLWAARFWLTLKTNVSKNNVTQVYF